jgi:hypothetical protein
MLFCNAPFSAMAVAQPSCFEVSDSVFNVSFSAVIDTTSGAQKKVVDALQVTGNVFIVE